MNASATLSRSKQYWEEMARLDPCWAILSHPSKKFRGSNLDAFYATGEKEISELMDSIVDLGYPRRMDMALDFGCGLGRLTRALGQYSEKCVGVDISEEMIRAARELNRGYSACEFLLNTGDSLCQFEAGCFDLIYTSIVLQHVPTKAAIKKYVAEFMRVLKPGGLLVMQVPSAIPLRRMLQTRRRLYELLRLLGFTASFLYQRLSLTPIRMTCVPEAEMLSLLESLGATILRHHPDSMGGPGIDSRTYFVTRRSS